MKIPTADNERDLKVALRSLESRWMNAILMKDKRLSSGVLSGLRFEIKKIMDDYQKLVQKDDGNKMVYHRLLGKIKRWAYSMERKLK